MKRFLLLAMFMSALRIQAGQSAPINGWTASDTASKSVPLRLDAGDTITLPFTTASTRPDTVCVLARVNNGSLAGKTITATFRISTSPNVIWTGGYTGGCPAPPNMRLYFTTRTGNFNLNYSDGKDPSSCWWSSATGVAMVDVDDGATYTFTAALDPAAWTNAHGQSGTTLPADWASALSTAVQIGFGFGAGCFYDTGVGVVSGPATMHVISYVAL